MDKQQQSIFTDNYIRNLKPRAVPYKRAEKAPKGEGRMQVRVMPDGTKEFYFRYRPNGRDKTVFLGRYDALGRSGMTLADLRDRAMRTRALQRSTGDVKEHEKAEERKKEIEARKGSLHQLLDAYVQSLRDANKLSADEVEGTFQRYVVKPFPEIVAKRANTVEPDDIQIILARMVKKGIQRQVNVTRAYLRAAFAYAAKADHDPRTVAKDGVLFNIKSNPVVVIPVIGEYEKPRDRALTEGELREYWNATEAIPLVQKATLRFNAALAFQRPKQLLRAGWDSLNFDLITEDFRGPVLLLKDGKGRKRNGEEARDHLVPLTEFAMQQLRPLIELNDKRKLQLTPEAEAAPNCNSPFTVDGKKRMVNTTLSHAIGEICATLKKEKKIEPFDQRDLRRTAESMLQKLRVDKEVRAHLLSHGRTTGVQSKHYERYDFLLEKRRALRKWASHLERIINAKPVEKVTPILKAA